MFQQTLAVTSLIALSAALKLENKGTNNNLIQKDTIWDQTLNLTSIESEAQRKKRDGGGDGSTTTTTDYSTLSFKDMEFFEDANPNYQSLTYQEKIDLLWSRITEDTTPQAMPWSQFNALFAQRGGASLKWKSDTIGPDK